MPPEDDPDAATVDAASSDTLVADSDTGETAGGGARLGRGATLGRYVVVDWLGAGGMGIVYKAYDPELDRAVALKLLRGLGHSKQRLLREAQAMARLQHPNVIAVHDVGSVGDQVFVAMELVEGDDLATWCRAGRPWREVLAVLRDAGRGLAAAHDAGIVHRDFKPGNVLVGRDGRARVLDFGLARFERATTPVPSATPVDDEHPLTQHGAVIGTLLYMPPEQLRGDRAGPAADQFAFAVALWEALAGVRPFAGQTVAELLAAIDAGAIVEPTARPAVPAAILRAIRRGLAADPAARYPDLHAFVAALDPEPAGRRRAGALAAVGVGLLGVAIAIGLTARSSSPPREPPCPDPAGRLAGIWDAATRAVVRDALARGGALGQAAWTGVAPRLDAYAARWTAAHQEACQATRVRHDYSEDVLDRRDACLLRRLDELAALSRALAAGEADVAASAIEAADALAPPERCAAVEQLMAVVAPPTDAATVDRIRRVEASLARADVAVELTRLGEAKQLVAAATTDAAAIAYPPLTARVELAHASALAAAYDAEGATHAFAALVAALAGRDDPTLAEAAITLISLDGRFGGDLAAARRWADVAGAVIARLGGDPDLESRRLVQLGLTLANGMGFDEATAVLAKGAALSEQARGVDSLVYARQLKATVDALERVELFARALPYARRAYDIFARVLGPDHRDTLYSARTLAVIQQAAGQQDEAQALLERVLDGCVRTAGEDSACTLGTLPELALVVGAQGDHARAYALVDRAEAGVRRAAGDSSVLLAVALDTRGLLLLDERRFAEARPVLEQAKAVAVASSGDSSLNTQMARYHVARAYAEGGDCAAALPLIHGLLDFAAAALPPGHALSAYPMQLLGECQLAGGDAPAAVATLERTLAIRDAVECRPAEKARTQLALARALIATGGDRARARALATAAVPAFRDSHRPREAAEAQAWLDATP